MGGNINTTRTKRYARDPLKSHGLGLPVQKLQLRLCFPTWWLIEVLVISKLGYKHDEPLQGSLNGGEITQLNDYIDTVTSI